MRLFPLEGRPRGEHPSCAGLPCLVPFLVCCSYGFSKQVQWRLPWFRELCWAGTPQLTSPLKTRIVCRGETDKLPSNDGAEGRGPEKDIGALWEAGMALNRFCVSLFSSVSRAHPTSPFAQLGTLHEFLLVKAFI